MDTNDSNSNSSIKNETSDGEEESNKQTPIDIDVKCEENEIKSEPTGAETNETSVASSSKKNNKESNDRKVQNLRKNIKGVLEETQLDEATLAAQKLELERLGRLQEAQRQTRESQRQILVEKHVIKTQQKVLSLLGESNEIPEHDVITVPTDVESIKREKSPADNSSLSCSNSNIIKEESDSNKLVVIDSDSDDCIILSDDEEEEELGSDDDENNSGEHTNDAFNTPDSLERVVINLGHKENEEKIFIAPQIARVIKPHQIGGIRFLFDNIIESTELFTKSTGFGCILAHSMGLGKTLQIVCFCDVLMRFTATKNILIIMPINTIQNWVNEFNLWTPSETLPSSDAIRRKFKIFAINESHKSLGARTKVVLDWRKEGGVLLLGYEMFRLLSLKKMSTGKKQKFTDVQEMTKREEESYTGIYEALVDPGPCVVICDEGHRIKNASASTSMALKQIKTKRRIVLTGYPLQNNLIEYWCMVDFVRPNYLGTKAEFTNMFERPIQNGQCIDSTPQDKKLMRFRAHVLHSLLKGFVQRRSHNVLHKCLPEKYEYVILIRMTAFQRKLYNTFMNEVIRSKKVQNPLKAFAVCCKIWNHPDILYNFLKKRELDLDIDFEDSLTANSVRKRKLGKTPTDQEKKTSSTSGIEMDSSPQNSMLSMENNHIPSLFGDSAYQSSNQSWSSSFRSSPMDSIINNQKNIPPKIFNGGLLQDVIEAEQMEKIKTDDDVQGGIPYDWAVELMKDYVPNLIENSAKLVVFLSILDESIKKGDRLLLFSQSLLTLNILEKFLQQNKIPLTETPWAKNASYFRLDGSTPALEREKLINEFNANENVKLFLVSTKAGSLGINLVGANRVVVFDASWNPCHDQQAVCRVYRYGQMKRCMIYRFVADNCLEKRIYDRQINKQGMADRIVDECNPDAHLSIKEVTSLCYEQGEDPEIQNFAHRKDEFVDDVMQKVLINHSSALTRVPFQHESLLVDRKEKKLSQAEKRLAQRGYEMEKQASNKTTSVTSLSYKFYKQSGEGNSLPKSSGGFLENQRPTIPMRFENPRPNRWIPVEVWQSKGITAHEMTLPQDVSIQTNSADKSKIFLKAGQKVVVLKSPRGICLQLESGKVIAIRASAKSGSQQLLNLNNVPSSAESSSDVIDMTNDDDETEEEPKRLSFSSSEEKSVEKNVKILPKPNLVQRKPKEQENLNTNGPKPSWNQPPPPPMSYYPYDQQQPQHSNGQYPKPAPLENRDGPTNGSSSQYNFGKSSAFHAPPSGPGSSTTPNYSMPPPYYPNDMFSANSFTNESNSFQSPNYNNYYQPPYSHSMQNYYSNSYDPQLPYCNMYQDFSAPHNSNYPYSAPPPPTNYPPPASGSNYNQWNYK